MDGRSAATPRHLCGAKLIVLSSLSAQDRSTGSR
jgi:hypothetical protein